MKKSLKMRKKVRIFTALIAETEIRQVQKTAFAVVQTFPKEKNENMVHSIVHI